jgi:hypothetical protein
MILLSLIDVDAVSMGIEAIIGLCVMGVVLLLLGALVFWLWYRKRSRSAREMIRPDDSPTLNPNQLNNPNQP